MCMYLPFYNCRILPCCWAALGCLSAWQPLCTSQKNGVGNYETKNLFIKLPGQKYLVCMGWIKSHASGRTQHVHTPGANDNDHHKCHRVSCVMTLMYTAVKSISNAMQEDRHIRL